MDDVIENSLKNIDNFYYRKKRLHFFDEELVKFSDELDPLQLDLNNFIYEEKMACSVRCILRSEKEEENMIRDYMLNKFVINREFYSDIENAVSVLVNIANIQGFIAKKNNGYFTINKENIEAKRIGKVLVELALEGVYTNGSNIPININILLGFVINKVESYLPEEQHGQLKYIWRNLIGFNY
jgi:hypothetical protein